jgi:hypothetical protein
MAWTLNDALQECARNTYNSKTMLRSSTGYSGKGLEYAIRLLSGINYAIAKTAREKVGTLLSSDVLLDDKSSFPITQLPGAVIRVNAVYVNREPVPYSVEVNESIKVDGYQGITVSVLYEVLPVSLTMNDLDNQLPIDERYIDPRVLCQYANYQFLSELGTDYDTARAQVWLGLFNDSFSNIVATNRLPRRVRYTG